MTPLTSTQRRELRAQAHHLHPVVMISDAGLKPEVAHEIDVNLKSHELIKIRVLGDDRAAREALVTAICETVDAQLVQHIGKMLVIYRQRPSDEVTKAPKRRRARKVARKTKRSFQKA